MPSSDLLLWLRTCDTLMNTRSRGILSLSSLLPPPSPDDESSRGAGFTLFLLDLVRWLRSIGNRGFHQFPASPRTKRSVVFFRQFAHFRHLCFRDLQRHSGVQRVPFRWVFSLLHDPVLMRLSNRCVSICPTNIVTLQVFCCVCQPQYAECCHTKPHIVVQL